MTETVSHSMYEACLLDLNQPVAKRTHAAFHLRTLGTLEASNAIARAVENRADSSLMRHELAYILGQMQFKGELSNIGKNFASRR